MLAARRRTGRRRPDLLRFDVVYKIKTQNPARSNLAGGRLAGMRGVPIKGVTFIGVPEYPVSLALGIRGTRKCSGGGRFLNQKSSPGAFAKYPVSLERGLDEGLIYWGLIYDANMTQKMRNFD